MTDQLDAAFAALSDPTRRDLVARLAIGDATVGELAAPYDMTIQAISKHLNVLAAAGLVTKRPQAQRRLVHLEADALRRLTDWVEHYAGLAEQRYSRLENVLASLAEAAPEEGNPS
ncbi:ArsR/SmtB family transcription factor [Micropruina sp.]|uniref:ArsR/SmtB family transcription factor n=1 Tax=Micropruina sp. TaxID=2737536 RepID=UPI0039E5D3F3